MKTPKIGILGGTFDPVHLAHLLIAQEAYQQLGLDQVWFMPSYVSPHKRGRSAASARDRFRMLKLAVGGDPRFKVSNMEIKLKGVSYTVNTLRKLSLQKPPKELYLIAGSDALKHFSRWRNPDQIVKLCHIAVVERPGFHLTTTGLRGKRIVRIKMPLLEISSSDIGRRVKSGQSITYLVPEKVKDYIEKHRLYRKVGY